MPIQVHGTPVAPRVSLRALWLVVLFFGTTAALHYLTPQIRPLYPVLNVLFSRHAVERIVFLIPVTVATVGLRSRAGWLTLAAAVVAMLPRAIWLSPYPADALLETAATAAVGALVVWTISVRTREKELRQQIAAENERLYRRSRFYARELVRVQEEERARIARDLHDETVQMLIVLSRRLDDLSAGAGSPPEEVAERLAAMRDLVAGARKTLRRLIYDLRPPTLDHLGVVPAIRGLVERLRAQGGLEATFEVAGGPGARLPADIELGLFRIAQEALNNVQRHARASQVEVRLAYEADRVRLVVEDDGEGFAHAGNGLELVSSGRLGLVSMAERASALDGVLDVLSMPGKGTTVTVEFSLSPAAPQ